MTARGVNCYALSEEIIALRRRVDALMDAGTQARAELDAWRRIASAIVHECGGQARFHRAVVMQFDERDVLHVIDEVAADGTRTGWVSVRYQHVEGPRGGA